MPNFLKKQGAKTVKVTKNISSRNVTPSTSSLASAEQRDANLERIDWALQITDIMKDISEGNPLLAPVKATCALLIRGLEITREALQSTSEWNTVYQSLEKQSEALKTFIQRLEQSDRRPTADLQLIYSKYLGAIQDVLAGATRPLKTPRPSISERFSFRKQSSSAIPKGESIADLRQKMDKAFEEFFAATLLFMSADMTQFASLATKLYDQVTETVNERRLEGSTDEDFDVDSLSRLLYGLDIPLCQPGTRMALLNDIHLWSKDRSTKEQIYWLKDAAGTGKTTVAATLARDWLLDRRLAGRFFFTPNSLASSGIDQFCATVAKDISKQSPSLEPIITRALSDYPPTHFGFHQQFQRLILDPLKSTRHDVPLVIVIDALDNCDPDGREELLSCMLERLPDIGHIRVFITSRPSPDIVNLLWNSVLVRGRDVQLLDVNDPVHGDVRIYVHGTLSKLTTQEREQVIEYSGGLFIVAATACRMLRWNLRPSELLNKLINEEKKDHLDELYLEVLRQAVSDPAAHDLMMSVLQTIITAFQPISINTIRSFLPGNVDVEAFVRDLGAVLKDGNPDRPIRVLHPTFREFLAEFDRANGFLVNSVSSHASTAMGCLSTLEKTLKFDILQLRKEYQASPRNSDVQNLQFRLVACTSPAVRYASSYWPYHVAASAHQADVLPKALAFLNTMFLNWLELMSLRGDVEDCIKGLSQLRTTIVRALRGRQISFGVDEVSTVSEAYQFLLRHQSMIQESALHIYSTALTFTPESNHLLKDYRKRHVSMMPRVISTIPILWDVYSVLSGHGDYLLQVEFSPDGNRLASISEDRSLILWDTASGAIVGHPFKADPDDKIAWLAFSLDSQRLVFATKSSKIHLWNALNGKSVGAVIDGGGGEMTQVAFVANSQRIISASAKPLDGHPKITNSLQLWDTSARKRIGEPIQLQGRPYAFSVSPDGSRVICVSRRGYVGEIVGAVTLWDLETISCLAEFDMPVVYGDSYCTSYSPTGNRFATWDGLGTLYICDGVSGDRINQVNGHKEVSDVVFSPNGRLLASCVKDDSVILLWNAESGSLEFSLSGHSDMIMHLSFSQDCARIASISNDQTVRVWDTTTGETLDSFFSGYTGNVDFGTLSTDWTKMATVSPSHYIRLHDVDAGTMCGNLEMEEEITWDFGRPHVSFSPMGDIMVCGYYYDLGDISKMDLWSVETGTPIGAPMTAHKGAVVSVSFSSDGRRVASVAGDNTVRIWDGSTGHPVGRPLGIEDGLYVTFSPDCRFVASSGYREMKVWDVHTEECVWSITRTTKTCAFSSNSTLLAGRHEGKLCLWRFQLRSLTPVMSSVDTDNFLALAFNPTDSLLASLTTEKIQLWSVVDDLQLFAEISISFKRGYRLGISTDSRFLAYGWLIWDISNPRAPTPITNPEETALSLDWRLFPHSLLAYDDGWIYSAIPPGPLMPVPRHLQDRFTDWHAHGYKMVVWTHQRLPIVIDCEPLLA